MTIADINAEARSLCDADTTSYIAADLLRRVNNAYETVIGWLINADGTWQFDDSNYTDIPEGTIDLTTAVASYTFSDELLQVEEVSVKDTGGTYRRIEPFDPSEIGMTAQEHFNDQTGRPTHYDKITDDTIKLYPTPITGSVTLTAGLKVRFKRKADLYTSAQVTTGTKVPGFASPWHSILAYMAAIPYCMSYKKDRVGLYEKRVEDLKRELIANYGRRERDKRKVATMQSIRFR